MLYLHRSDFKLLFLKHPYFGEKEIAEVVKSVK